MFFCCLSIPYCTRDHIIACTVHYHHYLFLTVLLLMLFLVLSSYNFILLLLSSLFVLLLLFVFIEKKPSFLALNVYLDLISARRPKVLSWDPK